MCSSAPRFTSGKPEIVITLLARLLEKRRPVGFHLLFLSSSPSSSERSSSLLVSEMNSGSFCIPSVMWLLTPPVQLQISSSLSGIVWKAVLKLVGDGECCAGEKFLSKGVFAEHAFAAERRYFACSFECRDIKFNAHWADFYIRNSLPHRFRHCRLRPVAVPHHTTAELTN